MRAYEISWTKEENLIQERHLKHTIYLANKQHHHYTIGKILIKSRDSGDSDSDDDHMIDMNIWRGGNLCYNKIYSDMNDSDSSSSIENSFNDCLKNLKVSDIL